MLAAFEAAVAKAPEIVECHPMTGQADYIVRLVASDANDLERLHATVLTRHSRPYAMTVAGGLLGEYGSVGP